MNNYMSPEDIKREKNRIKVQKYRARKKARELGIEVPEEYAYVREYEDNQDEPEDYNTGSSGNFITSFVLPCIGIGLVIFIGIIKASQEIKS